MTTIETFQKGAQVIRAAQRWSLPFLTPLLILLVAACSEATPTPSPTPVLRSGKQIAETASYRVELLFAPPIRSMMGVEMSTTDQGESVNQHLEIHIYQRASGAEVKGANPVVLIRNLTTGVSRELTNVRECVPPNDHGAGLHYGDNIYLPDGRYGITIKVASESAAFEILLRALAP